MSLLDGGGQALLTGIFSRLYVSGNVITVTDTYDEVGEITSVETTVPARVQVDAMTESMRAAEGSSESDRRIIVLAADGITVDSDAIIAVNSGPYAGSRWLVKDLDRDPCGAYWNCRARREPN